MSVNPGNLIRSLNFTDLANQVNAEIDRRGGGPKVTTSYSGSVTAGAYNAINTALQGAATPYNTGLPNVAVNQLIQASQINNLISAITAASNVCLCNCNYCTCNCNYCTCNCNYCTCNCNYCTCNCNYCTCNCNYACTCNCNYSDERVKTDIAYM